MKFFIFLTFSFLYTNLLFEPSLEAKEEINLRPYEEKVFSQQGEDGVIKQIFNLIPPKTKYYVEFGAADGHFLSNTQLLREKEGWTGLLLDAGYPNNPEINLHQEFITAENICDLFAKYEVPYEFDLLSLDIDYNDFYVWNALSAHYQPRIVVIEFNPTHLATEDKVIAYRADGWWDGSDYYGASMLALYRLGKKLGYSLVYQEANAVNLFFVRNDVLQKSRLKFKDMNDVTKLYNVPLHRKPGQPWDPLNRVFISSKEALELQPKPLVK